MTTTLRTPAHLQGRTRTGTPRIEAYVREDLQGASDRVSEVLERLTRLDDGGDVESVSVTEWTNSLPERPPSVSLSLSRNTVRETVEEFGEWAAHRGCSLAPAFDRPAGDASERLRVPIVGMAVYDAGDREDGDASDDGDDLLAVFPYTDRDGTVRTVEDGLAALEGST